MLIWVAYMCQYIYILIFFYIEYIEVIFPSKKKNEVVFHLQKNEVVLNSNRLRSYSTGKKCRSSSSIFKKIEVVLHFPKIEVVFHLEKNWCRLPFPKNIEVFFHISSSWVKIRLHIENQLPRLGWVGPTNYLVNHNSGWS